MPRSKNIECEIRGCITRGDFNDIKRDIEKDFGKMSESPELVIFFKGDYDLRLMINKSGGGLIFKETVDSKNHARRETEFKFSLDNIMGVLNFLVLLGFDKGLFSYCYRFDTNNIEQKISVKFDTKIGDLFEIEQVVDEKASFDKVQANLSRIAIKYGLTPWTLAAYNGIVKESWADVASEPLLTNNNPHPLIRRVIKESSKAKKSSISKITIATLLKEKSNDYAFLEKKFRRIVKENLLSWDYASFDNYQEQVSVIIPTYNSCKTLKLTLKSLEKQKLNLEQKKLIEVIVIDDGSEDKTGQMIKKENFKLNLKYVRQNNLGRSHARNLGVAISTGRILIFIDSDILLEKHFLNEHIKRQHYLDNIVLVSFKQNILIKDPILKKYFEIEKIFILTLGMILGLKERLKKIG